MADIAATGTSFPPQPLISLEAEERRKVLLESLCSDYPPFRQVSANISKISVNESRYITQFSSGRWRERIHDDNSDYLDTDSDDGDDSSDEEEEPPKLVITGYDLLSKEHRREKEMIQRWNIVERERHFPNMEKGFMDRRKAKDQFDDASVPQSSSLEDVAMEECQISPKIEATSSMSTKEVESKVPAQGSFQDEAMEESPESPKSEPETCQESHKIVPEVCQGSPKTVPQAEQVSPNPMLESCKESPKKNTVIASSGSESVKSGIRDTLATQQEGTDDSKEKASVSEDSKLSKSSTDPRDSKQAESSSESEDSKLAKTSAPEDPKLAHGSTVPEDSKVATSTPVPEEDSKLANKSSSESEDSKLVKSSSESEMETSGTSLRGKRKADSTASAEGDDPDEKRTRKSSGDK